MTKRIEVVGTLEGGEVEGGFYDSAFAIWVDGEIDSMSMDDIVSKFSGIPLSSRGTLNFGKAGWKNFGKVRLIIEEVADE